MKRLAHGFIALALGFTVTVPARAGDPKDEARRHEKAAREAMRQGDYALARQEWEATYAALPNFQVLYYLAEADLGLGLPEQTLDAFQRFLDEGGDRVPPTQREQVVEQMAQIERGFASVEITTEPAGAEITLDGAPQGRAPLAKPLRVRAGVHVIGATRAGAAPVTRVVTVKGGEQQRLSLPLPDLPPPAPVVVKSPPVAPPPPESREVRAAQHESRFPFGYVLIGAGVVAGGVAVTEYAWNHERVTRFHENEAALQTDTSLGRRDRVIQNDELADSIHRASAVTVGFGIGAGVLVAGGITWLLVEPGAKHERERASARVDTWVPDIVIGREALAASWRGTW